MSGNASPAASSNRTAVSQFAIASSQSVSATAVSAERSAEINAKAERVSARAEAHFAKHREVWTNRQYAQLLARDGGRMEFTPAGMVSDRKAHLMRAADHLVRHRQAQRLAKIDRVASRLAIGKRQEQGLGR